MITNTSKLLQSPTNRVKISSNFDTLISKYYPKANVTFTISDLEIKMNVIFEMNPPNKDRNKNTNEIVIAIKFYHKDKEIDYSDIHQSQFVELTTAYNQYVAILLKESIYKYKTSFSVNLTSILKAFKSLSKKFDLYSKLKEIRKILEQYKNLKAVDIYTNIKKGNQKNNDGNNTTIARTTIELDADILTIIPKDLLIDDNTYNNLLLNLHKSNVCFSNHLFLQPLFRIVIAIKTVKSIISLLPAPITAPLYTTLYSFFTQTTPVYTNYEFSIPFIATSLGIPAILFKVISKYIFPLILNKLAGQIKLNI
jgi:hypothetical protein